ncbi:MAG: hypothetical protein J6C27_05630 [Clostridia bacterium]|nr:hypothetical protein [Clostridia bacterium]
MKNSVKYILSLVFTLIIISSALKIDFDLDFKSDTSNTEATTQAIDEASARYVFETCLNASKIEFSKISVLTTKNADDSIVISKVLIFSKEEKSKILNSIEGITQNLEVEIINE